MKRGPGEARSAEAVRASHCGAAAFGLSPQPPHGLGQFSLPPAHRTRIDLLTRERNRAAITRSRVQRDHSAANSFKHYGAESLEQTKAFLCGTPVSTPTIGLGPDPKGPCKSSSELNDLNDGARADQGELPD